MSSEDLFLFYLKGKSLVNTAHFRPKFQHAFSAVQSLFFCADIRCEGVCSSKPKIFRSENEITLLYFIEFAKVTQHGDRGWNSTYVPEFISTLSFPTQTTKGWATPPWSTPSAIYEHQCVFFYLPQESEHLESCETGPTVFHPYPKRLECLTICRCHNKGSTFSSVILRRPECWSGRDLNPRTSARKTGPYPIDLTGRRH